MKRADKIAYDKDYAAAKKGGKPFFPYAIYKDTIIAGLAILAVIVLAITVRVHVGEPVNPATTDFVPRPEWYFYFAFELLKIFKNQNALTPVIMATFMVPNILIILLVVWPFIDRGPERRIWKRPFALGVAVIVTTLLCYLTFIGATTPEGVAKGQGLPLSGLDANATKGAALFLANGCTSCHMIKGVVHRTHHQVAAGTHRTDAVIRIAAAAGSERPGGTAHRTGHQVQVGRPVRDHGLVPGSRSAGPRLVLAHSGLRSNTCEYSSASPVQAARRTARAHSAHSPRAATTWVSACPMPDAR